MECNKDEAMWAKNIAEKMFELGNLEGANRFALKAQALYPSLEGIAQMITTFTIHLASKNNDWYSILSAPKTADDEMLRKRYKQLVLEIHPDKNNSVGADDAFKLVQQASELLRNKHKRASYDENILQLRRQKANKTPPPPPAARPQPSSNATRAPPGADREFHNFVDKAAASAAKKMAAQSSSATDAAVRQSRPPPSTPPLRRSSARASRNNKEVEDTFWTSCTTCHMQYEFFVRHLNGYIRCRSCNQPFIAAETQTRPPATETKRPEKNTTTGNNNNVSVGTCSSASAKMKMEFTGKDAATVGSSSSTAEGRCFSSSTAGQQARKPRNKKLKTSFDTRSVLMDKARNDLRKKLSEIRR